MNHEGEETKDQPWGERSSDESSTEEEDEVRTKWITHKISIVKLVLIINFTIKRNGKSLRRFDRSSVIIKQDVGSKICMDIYSYKEVRMCENY